MKQAEFLTQLRSCLSALPENEVADILRDQEEYIRDAISAGRSEEEAVRALGDPKALASSLVAELKIQHAEKSVNLQQQMSSTLSAVLAILALAPLNLIFVLGPYLGLMGGLIGLWAVALACACASVLGLGIFFSHLIFVGVGFWHQFSAFLFIMGTIGLSVLAILVMYQATVWIGRATIAYLKWNLSFIQARTK